MGKNKKANQIRVIYSQIMMIENTFSFLKLHNSVRLKYSKGLAVSSCLQAGYSPELMKNDRNTMKNNARKKEKMVK